VVVESEWFVGKKWVIPAAGRWQKWGKVGALAGE
jgi:hypothetical protein